MEQQQPGIDKKAVAAILLCAVIWAVWMNTNYRKTQQLAAQKAAEQKAAITTTAGAIAMTTGTAGERVVATPAMPDATPPPAAAPATTIQLENELLALELSSRGARPTGAALKKYHKGKLEDAEQALAQLVPETVEGAKEVVPLAPWFGDDESSQIPADASFSAVSSGGIATFQWTGPSGLSLTRTYRVGSEYTVEMTEQYTNRGASPVTGRAGVVWGANDVASKRAKISGPIEPGAAVSNRFQYKTPKNPEDDKRTYSGPVEFIAVHDRYFTAAVAPVEPQFEGKDSVRFRRPAEKALMVLALDEKTTLAPGESKTLTYELYIGPKDYAILRELGHHLSWVMNWGQGQGFFWAFIGAITKGLWYALGWLHGFVRNWGVAIILLTVVMRGLLWPLAARQMRMANEFSMKSQKLKPQIDKLREKYAADPMEMNKQTMALYKQYGISPFSPLAGCLPLLLQLPIWWALYRVLWTSIDLREAPFVLWIDDLSKPETFLQIGTFDLRLMPILLGAVTWLQMKLTPQAGTDPMQQKMMMYMMPVMFCFFMWSLPAGLVVYIFTSTLIGIVQQWLLKRSMARPAEAT